MSKYKLDIYRHALKKINDYFWFDKTRKPGAACHCCDMGEAGDETNSDGHDYDCPVSLAHWALIKGEAENEENA